MSTIRSVCVYCGSSPGRDTAHVEAGRALGRALAEAGMELVYGGGIRGVMGAVADGVRESGGRVVGIIPRFLVEKEATRAALDRLDELVLTEDMHERKQAMFERSDAFVALPGGIGTLEELVEILTWGQLGRHEKPVVVADIAGFWRPLAELLDHMDAEGFLHSAARARPLVLPDVPAVVERLSAHRLPKDAEGRPEIIERL